MQRRRSRFLRARQNKIEPVNFTTPAAKHRRNLHGERCRGKLPASPTNLSLLRLRSIVRLCQKQFARLFRIPSSFSPLH